MVLTPSYHVFAMFSVHQDARLLKSQLECEDYRFGKERIPALSSSVSRASDGRINVSLCNVNPKDSIRVACEISGGRYRKIEGRILKGDAINVHNTFDAPDRVRPMAFEAFNGTDSGFDTELPPMSVATLCLSD